MYFVFCVGFVLWLLLWVVCLLLLCFSFWFRLCVCVVNCLLNRPNSTQPAGAGTLWPGTLWPDALCLCLLWRCLFWFLCAGKTTRHQRVLAHNGPMHCVCCLLCCCSFVVVCVPCLFCVCCLCWYVFVVCLRVLSLVVIYSVLVCLFWCCCWRCVGCVLLLCFS